MGLNSLVCFKLEDFGNPFEEDSQDLLVLDNKEIAPSQAVDDLRCANKVGQVQFENFVRERLVERTKPLSRRSHPKKQAENIQSVCYNSQAHEIPQE